MDEEIWQTLHALQEGLNKLYTRLGPPPGWNDAERPKVSPEDAQSPEKACEAYESWGGFDHDCENCDRPAWEHEGWRGRSVSPFEDFKGKPQPWTGLMRDVRDAYLEGRTVEIVSAADGGKRIRVK